MTVNQVQESVNKLDKTVSSLRTTVSDLKDELEKQVDDSHKQDLKETFNDTIDLKEPDDLIEPEFISYDLVKDNEESKQKEDDAQIAESKTKTLLDETQSWWEKLLLWIMK